MARLCRAAEGPRDRRQPLAGFLQEVSDNLQESFWLILRQHVTAIREQFQLCAGYFFRNQRRLRRWTDPIMGPGKHQGGTSDRCQLFNKVECPQETTKPQV